VTLRALAVAVVVGALVLVPSAGAKFRMSLALRPARPAVAQPVELALRTEVELSEDQTMRLLAVAPGVQLYSALGRLDGRPRLDRRHGFLVPLARTAPDAWEATIQFPRRGGWRLVVPNWGAPGYAIPPPLVRQVWVRRR
jgi:hypothetical protein